MVSKRELEVGAPDDPILRTWFFFWISGVPEVWFCFDKLLE